MPVFSVLIVGYNSLAHLNAAFSSLLATRHAAFEVLFLDNASPQDEAGFVESAFPDPRVRVLRSPRNLLFAGGVNLLARAAAGRYIVLLNPDTVVDPEWLTIAERALAGGAWDAAQIDLREAANRDRHESQGPSLDRLGFTRHVRRPEATEPFRIFSGRGAGVVVDRELFLRLGGLDEDMGMYFEETDFFWRLNIAGGRAGFIPGALVYHVRGGSARRGGFDWTAFRYTRNRVGSLAKNLEAPSVFFFLAAHFAIFAFRVPMFLLTGKARRALGEAAGLAAAFVRLPRFFAKRAEIRALRKRRDADLIRAGLLLSPGKPRLMLTGLLKFVFTGGNSKLPSMREAPPARED